MGRFNDKSKLINDDINEDGIGIGIENSKKCRIKYYHILFMIMISSIIFQAISFFYLYEIGMAAKDIETYTVNQTETHEYISKLKKIINFICDHEDIC